MVLGLVLSPSNTNLAAVARRLVTGWGVALAIKVGVEQLIVVGRRVDERTVLAGAAGVLFHLVTPIIITTSEGHQLRLFLSPASLKGN